MIVENTFEMFSRAHWAAIVALFFVIVLLYFSKKKWSFQPQKLRRIERIFAWSLLIMDVLYYIWLFQAGRWNVSNSMPLELCSISLAMTIILLWTGNKHVYDFVFYAGIGGALQAVATPVLDMGFPHFRYFHFFYTHIGIVITALYFTWVKGYRPTFYLHSSKLDDSDSSMKKQNLLYSIKKDTVILPLFEVAQLLKGKSSYPNLLSYVEEMIQINSTSK